MRKPLKPGERGRRLARLAHLRALGAPSWVIRSDQVALACRRRGLRPPRIDQTPGSYCGALLAKYVTPLTEE